MNTETWYVLETGEVGDPRDISPGKDGKLVHKDGRKVAYAPHGPRSRSVDAEAERSKKPAPVVEPKTEDMQPEPPPVTTTRPGYKTRGRSG